MGGYLPCTLEGGQMGGKVELSGEVVHLILIYY